METAKVAAIAHWTDKPCGLVDVDIESSDFFPSIDRQRYVDYAPWLNEVVDFRRFAGSAVLEVGCGLGTDLYRFASAGATVSAIDLVKRHLAIAQARFRNSPYQARLARADAEYLPYRDESFDLVYSFGVLHHTPDPRRAVAEIHRVLRRGGRAIIAVYNFFSINLLLTLCLNPVRGRLFREPFSRSLARIEGAGDDGPTPLVKLYTARTLRHALSPFGRVEIRQRHLVGPIVDRLPADLREALSKRVGWYLIAESIK